MNYFTCTDADFNPPRTTGVTEQNRTEVPIDTVDDTNPEGDERFEITIVATPIDGGPKVEAGTSDTANITIIDNDGECVLYSMYRVQTHVIG